LYICKEYCEYVVIKRERRNKKTADENQKLKHTYKSPHHDMLAAIVVETNPMANTAVL